MKYKIIHTTGNCQTTEEFEFSSFEDFIEYKQYMFWESNEYISVLAQEQENFKSMVEAYLQEEDVQEPKDPEDIKH